MRSDQHPPVVEEEAQFKNMQRSWKEQKTWSGVRTGLETKTDCAGEDQQRSVLPRTSLLFCSHFYVMLSMSSIPGDYADSAVVTVEQRRQRTTARGGLPMYKRSLNRGISPVICAQVTRRITKWPPRNTPVAAQWRTLTWKERKLVVSSSFRNIWLDFATAFMYAIYPPISFPFFSTP
jgi:hypothetical protein